jgi:hypothetical protein
VKYLAGTAQASVAILYPVCRWLSDQDKAAFTVIDAALRPKHVVDGAANALVASMQVGEDIGLLERLGRSGTRVEGAEWALRKPALEQRDEWYESPVRFRMLVRRKLLAKAVDEIAKGKPPSDVAVGLAWLLAQDIVRPLPRAYSDGPERALHDQKLASYITTEEQWRPFLRWAVALGCAEFSQIGNRQIVLPDPTAALAEELPLVPRAGMSASDFCAAAAKELPVLDGGHISNFVRAEQAEWADPRGDALVGPAFSLALRRLQGQGLIELRHTADAGNRVNGVLHGQRWTFDRVTRGGGNGND